MFTLVTFLSLTTAIQKTVFISLDNEESLKRFKEFDVSTCKCYDPNEQSKLLTVIEATGKALFNSRIQEYANALTASKINENSFLLSLMMPGSMKGSMFSSLSSSGKGDVFSSSPIPTK